MIILVLCRLFRPLLSSMARFVYMKQNILIITLMHVHARQLVKCVTAVSQDQKR